MISMFLESSGNINFTKSSHIRHFFHRRYFRSVMLGSLLVQWYIGIPLRQMFGVIALRNCGCKLALRIGSRRYDTNEKINKCLGI